MKNGSILLLLAIALTSANVFAQDTKELEPGYYVVVGAYAKTKANIAQNYVETLKLSGVQAGYGFNASRNLYFVYVKYFNNLKESLQHMGSVRKKEEFKDAWVRVVPGYVTPLANNTSATTTTATTNTDLNNSPAVTKSETKPANAGAGC